MRRPGARLALTAALIVILTTSTVASLNVVWAVNTVTTTTISSTTGYPFETHGFFDATKFWVFTNVGGELKYETSSDGNVWSIANPTPGPNVIPTYGLYIDNSYSNGCVYANSCSVSVTTTHAGDLIYCEALEEGASSVAITAFSDAGLNTWTQRASVSIAGEGYEYTEDTQLAGGASLTADSVTATFGSALDSIVVTCLAIQGANGFDANAAVPATASSSSSATSLAAPITTSTATDMIIAFGGILNNIPYQATPYAPLIWPTTGVANTPSGMDMVMKPPTSTTGLGEELNGPYTPVAYVDVSQTQSATNYGFQAQVATTGSLLIVDAIVAASSANTISTYTTSVDTQHNIYWAATEDNGSARFRWGYGPDSSQGFIPSWTVYNAQVPTTYPDVNYVDMLTPTGPSNVWVAVSTYDGTNYHIEVWVYGGSSWTKVDDINTGTTEDAAILNYFGGGDYSLTYGSVAAAGSKLSIITTTNSGTTWSAATLTTSTYGILDSGSCANRCNTADTTLYFAGRYISGSNYGIIFWSCTFPCSSAPTETILHAASSSSLYMGSIASGNQNPGYLVVAYSYSTATLIYYRTSYNGGSSWSDEFGTPSAETSIQADSLELLQNGGLAGNLAVGAIWEAASASPWNVRFAYLQSSSTDASNSVTSLGYSFQSHEFYSAVAGLYFLIGSDNTNMFYISSANGATGWSPKTAVRAAGNGGVFSIYYDNTNNTVYIADDATSDTLNTFCATPLSSGVLSFLAACGGSSGLTTTWSASPGTLETPGAIAFDGSGNLWVADTANSRILEFKMPITDQAQASLVLGQPNLYYSATACTSTGLNDPAGIAFDPSGNLWVADTGNNRIVEFTTPFTTGEAESIVIGQSSFTTCTATSASSTTVDGPAALAFDSSGDLWISDTTYNRVLEYTTPLSTHEGASVVLGQTAGSFTTHAAACTATGVSSPEGLLFNAGNLWLADEGNHRVLEYTTLTSSSSATLVLGQAATFTTCTSADTQAGMAGPYSITFDQGGNIWVSDITNNRLTEYTPSFSSGESATSVIGQSSYTTGAASTAQNGLNHPYAVIYHSNSLWVDDRSNNRIIDFQAPYSTGTTNMFASTVVGQLSFTATAGYASLQDPTVWSGSTTGPGTGITVATGMGFPFYGIALIHCSSSCSVATSWTVMYQTTDPSPNNIEAGIILGSGGGHLMLLYGSLTNTNQPVEVVESANSGSTWTSPASTTHLYMMEQVDAVNIGSTIYFAGVTGTGQNNIDFWSCAATCASIPAPTMLFGGGSTNAVGVDVALSTDGNQFLALAFAPLDVGSGDFSTIYYSSSTNAGTTWLTPTTATVTEDYLDTGIGSATHVGPNNALPLYWTEDVGTPYAIETLAPVLQGPTILIPAVLSVASAIHGGWGVLQSLGISLSPRLQGVLGFVAHLGNSLSLSSSVNQAIALARSAAESLSPIVGSALTGGMSGSLALFPGVNQALAGIPGSASLVLGAAVKEAAGGITAITNVALSAVLSLQGAFAAFLSGSVSLSSSLGQGVSGVLSTSVSLFAKINGEIGNAVSSGVSTAATINQGLGNLFPGAETLSPSLKSGSLFASITAPITLSSRVSQGVTASMSSVASLVVTLGQGLAGLSESVNQSLSPNLGQAIGNIQSVTLTLAASAAGTISGFVAFLHAPMSLSSTLNQAVSAAQSAGSTLTPILSGALNGFVAILVASINLSPNLGQALGNIIQSVTVTLAASLTAALTGFVAFLHAPLSLSTTLNQAISVAQSADTSLTAIFSTALNGFVAILVTAIDLTPGLGQAIGNIQSVTLTLEASITAAINGFVAFFHAPMSLSSTLNQAISAAQSAGTTLLAALGAIFSVVSSFQATLRAAISLNPTLNQGIGIQISRIVSLSASLNQGIAGTLSTGLSLLERLNMTIYLAVRAGASVTPSLFQAIGNILALPITAVAQLNHSLIQFFPFFWFPLLLLLLLLLLVFAYSWRSRRQKRERTRMTFG